MSKSEGNGSFVWHQRKEMECSHLKFAASLNMGENLLANYIVQGYGQKCWD